MPLETLWEEIKILRQPIPSAAEGKHKTRCSGSLQIHSVKPQPLVRPPRLLDRRLRSGRGLGSVSHPCPEVLSVKRLPSAGVLPLESLQPLGVGPLQRSDRQARWARARLLVNPLHQEPHLPLGNPLRRDPRQHSDRLPLREQPLPLVNLPLVKLRLPANHLHLDTPRLRVKPLRLDRLQLRVKPLPLVKQIR